MGRLFEVLLKRPGPPEAPAEPRPGSTPPAGRPSAPPREEVPESPEEEVPFIEIGPRRGSMEASASVLATAPAARKVAPPPPPAPAPVAEAPRSPSVVLRPVSPSARRSVTFRAVERRPRFPPELVAYHSPGQAVSAPYRELLTALLATTGTKAGAAALLFTAPAPGIGTTTVLLNVAIIAAQRGRHVVVVDANLGAPAVADRLGLDREPGFREVLAGSVTIGQALQQTEQEGLLALTVGEETEVGPQPEPLRSLLRLLRSRFDLVLIDGPAWDGQADFALGAACDAVYLVVPEADADAPAVTALLGRMGEQGARPAGCVLTGR